MKRIDTPNAALDIFGAGKNGYRDGNKAAGINPTELSAAIMNAIQEELAAIPESVGMALDGTNNHQVLEAIQRMIDAQSGNYALDTGAANAYVIALNPAISAYPDGLTVRFKIANSNTGASTLNAGAGAVPWVNDAGGALAQGDAPAGSIATAIYIASANKFYTTSMVQSQGDARYAKLTDKNYNTQIITATGNFTTPANITTATVFKITLIGGGGGGGGTTGVSVAGGGGAGAVATFLISGLQPNTNYAVVIGAGGTPGAAGGANNGTTGGTTQITINGTVYSCAGGLFGRQASGSGFTPTQAQGAVSASITALTSAVLTYQSQTRDGFYSGATVYVVSLGGGIPFGQGGDTYEGVAASGYGAGGCGGMAGLAGIAGRPGLCLVEWVA